MVQTQMNQLNFNLGRLIQKHGMVFPTSFYQFHSSLCTWRFHNLSALTLFCFFFKWYNTNKVNYTPLAAAQITRLNIQEWHCHQGNIQLWTFAVSFSTLSCTFLGQGILMDAELESFCLDARVKAAIGNFSPCQNIFLLPYITTGAGSGQLNTYTNQNLKWYSELFDVK